MKLGDYLRLVRERREWTQPTAASKVGIEQSYLSKLETGKSYPSEEIFEKLTSAYQIDIDNLTAQVSDEELEKLRTVRSVHSNVLGNHRRENLNSRNWLVAGLIALTLSGASFGAAFVPDQGDRKYQYRSQGLLLAGEQLSAFEAVNRGDTVLSQELLERLDQVDKVIDTYKGESFIEDTIEGRRFYQLYAQPESTKHSPIRFFIIPALALLFSAMGCFLIGLLRKS